MLVPHSPISATLIIKQLLVMEQGVGNLGSIALRCPFAVCSHEDSSLARHCCGLYHNTDLIAFPGVVSAHQSCQNAAWNADHSKSFA